MRWGRGKKWRTEWRKGVGGWEAWLGLHEVKDALERKERGSRGLV